MADTQVQYFLFTLAVVDPKSLKKTLLHTHRHTHKGPDYCVYNPLSDGKTELSKRESVWSKRRERCETACR